MVAEETAKPHESFTQTFSKAPAAPGREIESPKFSPNVRSFLPNNLAFFNYKGSLTTPPCSEGVEWIVFTDTISVTPAQVSFVCPSLFLSPFHVRRHSPLRLSGTSVYNRSLAMTARVEPNSLACRCWTSKTTWVMASTTQ